MKNPKQKSAPLTFRIQKNTDTVDIDSKCLGLSSWVVGDSTNQLNTNRGLHIQVRHNRDKDTFEAANELSTLIAAAPKMLEVLDLLQHWLAEKQKVNFAADNKIALDQINEVVAKARGSK